MVPAKEAYIMSDPDLSTSSAEPMKKVKKKKKTKKLLCQPLKDTESPESGLDAGGTCSPKDTGNHSDSLDLYRDARPATFARYNKGDEELLLRCVKKHGRDWVRVQKDFEKEATGPLRSPGSLRAKYVRFMAQNKAKAPASKSPNTARAPKAKTSKSSLPAKAAPNALQTPAVMASTPKAFSEPAWTSMELRKLGAIGAPTSPPVVYASFVLNFPSTRRSQASVFKRWQQIHQDRAANKGNTTVGAELCELMHGDGEVEAEAEAGQAEGMEQKETRSRRYGNGGTAVLSDEAEAQPRKKSGGKAHRQDREENEDAKSGDGEEGEDIVETVQQRKKRGRHSGGMKKEVHSEKGQQMTKRRRTSSDEGALHGEEEAWHADHEQPRSGPAAATAAERPSRAASRVEDPSYFDFKILREPNGICFQSCPPGYGIRIFTSDNYQIVEPKDVLARPDVASDAAYAFNIKESGAILPLKLPHNTEIKASSAKAKGGYSNTTFAGPDGWTVRFLGALP